MSSEKTQPAKLSIDEKVRLFKKRFAVREDVFLEKKTFMGTETDKETGEQIKKPVSTFMPVCVNHMDPKVCLLVGKKGKCATCTNKQYEVLTDSWLREHILGNRILCLIPQTPEGTKLGAIDFDVAVSGGLRGIFEDAKRVKDFCAKLGIQSYIARSSNKGYHLYFWFDKWLPPHHFTSFASWLLIQTGFANRLSIHGIKMPEVFPKQTLYNKADVGNGIRAPLSEPDVRDGRNCFVDDDSNPYPLLRQWQVFAEMSENSVDFFENFLKEKEVPIYADAVSRTGIQKKRVKKNAETGAEEIEEVEETGPIDKRGSFWNIVAACPAMQEYWAKLPNGQYEWDTTNPKGLFHAARLASMNLAIATKDGEDILRKRWPGDKTEGALIGALSKGYRPASCAWMQEQGVCRVGKHPKFGNHCFKALPPVHYENGKLISNPDNVPEENWPSPSPVRHATENHLSVEEICERFRLLVAALKRTFKKDAEFEATPLNEAGRPELKNIGEKFTPENAGELIGTLMERVAKLSSKDKEIVTSFVRANKIFSVTEWNAKLKAAGITVSEEKKKEAKANFKSFVRNGKHYFLRDGKIVTMFTDSKGQQHEEVFTNFWIERKDEPAHIRVIEKNGVEISIYEDRMYKLDIHVNGQVKPITIPNKVYSNPNSFFENVRAGGGTELIMSTSKDSYDILMTAITEFSEPLAEKFFLRDIGYHKLQGKSRYIMPGVLVTDEQIVPNETYLVELSDDFSRGLDFQVIGDERFKEVSAHIVKDFFNCNNPMLTMACFGHAMASVCTEKIYEACNWRKAPVLWIAGDFAGGKTFVIENAQYFFGNFAKTGQLGAGGSFKAKIGVANVYRHAFLGFDDHKDTTQKDRGQEIVNLIQNAYDRRSNAAMQRDGTLRKNAALVRGLIAVNGEDFPDKEASAVSRLILIDTKMNKRIEEGQRVLSMRHLYSGFTPYVVRHILGMPKEAVAALWKETFARIYGGSGGSEEKMSATRICENLTLNFFGFRVALDCMASTGAISSMETEALSEQHMKNLLIIKQTQMHSVADARASQVFVNDMSQLLADPRKYKIHGWPGSELEDFKHAKTLGFWAEKEPDTIFLYPDLAYEAVAQFARSKSTTVQSMPHIMRQMFEDGYLVERLLSRKGNRYQCQRRTPNKQSTRVYPVRADILGFDRVSNQAGQASEKTSAPVQKISSKEDEFALE